VVKVRASYGSPGRLDPPSFLGETNETKEESECVTRNRGVMGGGGNLGCSVAYKGKKSRCPFWGGEGGYSHLEKGRGLKKVGFSK